MKRKMRVNWAAYNTITLKDGRLYSHFASARYRVIQPMTDLARLGHEVSLVQIHHDAKASELIKQFDGEVIVFSKLIAPQRDLFDKVSETRQALIQLLRSSGRRVLADINDDYFDHDLYGASFRDVAKRVDGVVTSTPEMRAAAAAHTSCPLFIVTDAFEGPHGEAEFAPPPRASGSRLTSWLKTGIRQRCALHLLWFGHESNWDSMRQALLEMPFSGIGPVELEIITSAGCGVEAFCEQFNARHRRACYVRFTPWSLESVWAGLARAALVLIPSRLDEQIKAAKSPNRLVETLRGGRFAIADAVPSYRSLASYCHLGGGMVAGLNWALDRPDDVHARICEGQAYVEANHSPAAVAAAWERVLQQTLGQSA